MENSTLIIIGIILFVLLASIVFAGQLDSLKTTTQSLEEDVSELYDRNSALKQELELLNMYVVLTSCWLDFYRGIIDLERVFNQHVRYGRFKGSQDEFRVAFCDHVDYKNKFVTKETFEENFKVINDSIDKSFNEIILQNDLLSQNVMNQRNEIKDIYKNKLQGINKKVEQDRIGTQFMLGIIDKEGVASQLERYNIPENGMIEFLEKQKQEFESRFISVSENEKVQKQVANHLKNTKISFMEVQKEFLTLDRKNTHAFMKLGIKLEITKKEDKQLSKKANKALVKLEKKASNGKNQN